MLYYYLKIALRHLLKSKSFSIITIPGLALGISVFILIVQYASFELSYDHFHENKHEIYRVAYRQFENGELKHESAANFMGLAHWINDQFPEVKKSTRFWRIPANSKFLLQYNNRLFNESGKRIVADSTFFEVFPSLLLRGESQGVLKDRHSLVLSERMVKKIFGDEDPYGKIISSSEFNQQYEITGILRDIPENSHMDVDFITLHDYTWDNPEQNWEGPWRYTYITMNTEVDPAVFEKRLNATFPMMASKNVKMKDVSFFLQAITDIHLKSKLKDDMKANGNEDLVYILLAVAMVILSIAWINFVNIETSRFMRRVKEVGVRRVVGGGKHELVIQFLVEYGCALAMAISLSAVMLIFSLPYTSLFVGIPQQQFFLIHGPLLTAAIAFLVVGSLLTGIYPGLLILQVNPIQAIKGKLITIKNTYLKKSLLTFQFVASVVLIAFVIVVYQQLNFMRTTDKKIDLEQVITIVNPTVYSSSEEQNGGEGAYHNFSTLRNAIMQNPAIQSVCTSSAIPGERIGFTYTNLTKRNSTDPYDPTRYKVLFIDYNFIPLYGLNLKVGRNYSPDNGEDKNNHTLILNESAIHALNFPSAEDALDQEISFMVDDEWNKYRIVGILEDYHHEAINNAVYPTIYYQNQNRGQQVYYSVKLNAGVNIADALKSVEHGWKITFPEKPFEFYFLDEFYDRQFKSELRAGRIFSLFGAVAIFLAGLGILGLTSFEMTSRLKEISIRKVLGASPINLIVLLSREQIRSVSYAMILSIPLIYFFSSEWLSSYPVRINISPLVFVIPFTSLVLLVATTSGLQTAKAVHTNPMDHLKE